MIKPKLDKAKPKARPWEVYVERQGHGSQIYYIDLVSELFFLDGGEVNAMKHGDIISVNLTMKLKVK